VSRSVVHVLHKDMYLHKTNRECNQIFIFLIALDLKKTFPVDIRKLYVAI